MAFPIICGHFRIDLMRATDLGTVIEMGLSTPELHTGTNSPQFYSKETMLRWIEAERGLLLVKRLDERLLAFSIASANPDCRDGYIPCVLTHPDFRGQGHAKSLLEVTFAWLQNKMVCNNVFCLVQLNNAGMLRLCEKSGMVVGEQFRYVQRSLP